jgi:hypothetical protein
MSLQSRALKAVDQATESGEGHPLETCGGGGGGAVLLYEARVITFVGGEKML